MDLLRGRGAREGVDATMRMLALVWAANDSCALVTRSRGRSAPEHVNAVPVCASPQGLRSHVRISPTRPAATTSLARVCASCLQQGNLIAPADIIANLRGIDLVHPHVGASEDVSA